MEGRTQTPAQAWRTGRTIWFALLGGPTMLAVLVLGVLPPGGAGASDPGVAAGVAWAALCATVLAIPLAYALRRGIWARGTKDGVVAPGRWLRGSLVCWALCEGACLLGLVAVMLDRPSPERLAVPAAAFLAQVLAFPRPEPLGLGAA